MKDLWKRLSPGVKTILVGIGSTAAGSALDAIVSGIATGEVRRPADIAKTGGIAALIGIRTYWMRKPTDPPPFR